MNFEELAKCYDGHAAASDADAERQHLSDEFRENSRGYARMFRVGAAALRFAAAYKLACSNKTIVGGGGSPVADLLEACQSTEEALDAAEFALASLSPIVEREA